MSIYKVKDGGSAIHAKKQKYEVVKINDAGEVVGTIHKEKELAFVDSTPHIKVYDPYKFLSLSMAGFKVLCYVMKYTRYGNNLTFDMQRCMKDIGLKKSGAYEGLKELTDLDIIHRVAVHQYEVNPNLMFKGNRTGYIRQQFNN